MTPPSKAISEAAVAHTKRAAPISLVPFPAVSVSVYGSIYILFLCLVPSIPSSLYPSPSPSVPTPASGSVAGHAYDLISGYDSVSIKSGLL